MSETGRIQKFILFAYSLLLLIAGHPLVVLGQDIRINTVSSNPLHKLSRQAIFEIRKSKIAEYGWLGIYPANYTPDPSIYGTIDERADWANDTQFFVLNPYALVLTSGGNTVNPLLPYCGVDHIEYGANSVSVNYSGETARKWFYAIFDYYSQTSGITRLWLVNAYDAGFRFAHVDISRSLNIDPLPGASDDSITRGIYSGREFYHFGHLGKNNISVDDIRAKLKIKAKGASTVIYVKLWRNRPMSPEDREDFAYVINIVP